MSLFLTLVLLAPADTHCRAAALGMMLKARYAAVIGEYQRALDLADEAMTCEPLAADAAFLKISILEERDQERLVMSNSQRELVQNLTTCLEKYPNDYRFPHKLGVLIVKNPGWVVTHHLEDPKILLNRALGLLEKARLEDADSSTIRSDMLYHIGRWHMINFQPYDAAQSFAGVCELDSSSLWAWYYAGRGFEASHQLRRALEAYRQFSRLVAHDSWGRKPAVHLNIALLELLLEPGDEQMVTYWDLLKEEGLAADMMLNAAVRLEKMRHYDRAMELLEAVDHDDRDLDFYLLYSRLHLSQGLYEAWLAKALVLLETRLPQRIRLVLVDTALDAALLSESWPKVLQLEKQHRDLEQVATRLKVFAALVVALEQKDPKALVALAAASPADPVIRFWKDLSDRFGLEKTVQRAMLLVYLGQNDYENAYKYLERNDAINEPGTLIREELALICAVSGRYELGFRLYDEMLAESPDRIDLLNNYAYFLSEAGQQLEKAREMLTRVVQSDNSSSAHLDSMGWVLYKMGRYREAEGWLNRALANDGNDPEQNEHLGDILQALGRTEEARRHWSRAMEQSLTRYPELLQKLDPGP